MNNAKWSRLERYRVSMAEILHGKRLQIDGPFNFHSIINKRITKKHLMAFENFVAILVT